MRATVAIAIAAGTTALVAIVSAGVGFSQWRLGRETLELSQRAYIGITAVRFAQPLKIGEPVRIVGDMGNFGNTPGGPVETSASFEFWKPPLGQVKLERAPSHPRESRPIILPKITQRILHQSMTPVRPEDLAALSSGGKALYVLGAGEYLDIFGAKRTFKFCFRAVSPDQGDFDICESHNSMD